MVRLRVVDVQLERPPLVGLDQREEVLRLMQHRVGADDVVGVGPQTRALRRTGRQNLQDVPDVFVGPLEGAEPDGDAEESLPAPQRARSDEYFADLRKIKISNNGSQKIDNFSQIMRPKK